MSRRLLSRRLTRPGLRLALSAFVSLLLLTPGAAEAKPKKPKPVDDYLQLEVLGICPAEERLVLIERRLDLPYHFDTVDLVLRDLKPARSKKNRKGPKLPSLKERGRQPLMKAKLRRRLKRKGLKPLYDVELKDAVSARQGELGEQGCEPGVAIAVDDALDFVFELAGTPYRFELRDDGKRMTASCAITGPDAPKSVREERQDVLWYAESKLSVRPLLPERIAEVRVFAKASLLTVVVRSVDPPRYDVGATDYLFVFAL